MKRLVANHSRSSGSRRPFLLLLALLAGCSSPPPYESADVYYYQGRPELLEAAYRGALESTDQNSLLGIDKLLSAALLRQDWDEAEIRAIRASTLVNVFVAGDPAEKDALGLFGQEKDKPFKGEPHERVMVDFYLGILRFRIGDYEGALAAFRSAMYKDRGSFLLPVDEEDAERGDDNVERYLYRDDYALLKFLAAKCYQLLGEPDEARKQLEEARKIHPALGRLFEAGMDSRNNVLVVIEGGRAPIKLKTGPRGAILGYRAGPRSDVQGVYLGDQGLLFGQCEDLHYQATTVGGRAVDELNQVKARRQELLQAAGYMTTLAGYGLLIGGAATRGEAGRNLQTAGFIAFLVGLGVMIFAEHAIDPSADTRSWSTLPGQLFLAVGRAPPGTKVLLRVVAQAPGGPDETQEWTGVPIGEGVTLLPIRLLPGRTGGPWEKDAEVRIPDADLMNGEESPDS